jgi:hypothetical protein
MDRLAVVWPDYLAPMRRERAARPRHFGRSEPEVSGVGIELSVAEGLALPPASGPADGAGGSDRTLCRAAAGS